jgi:exodeoxyribonuclease VII small subunit
MVKKINKKNFEGSLEELEQIVDGLESGDLSLEKSIEQFEVGVSLYKECKKILDKAEKKISVLTDSLKEESQE